MSDLDKLIAQARRAGWRVTKTTRGHWKFWSPDGKHAVVASGTPSDRRAVANLRAQLKRAGFKAATGRPRKAPKPLPAVEVPLPVPAPPPAPEPPPELVAPVPDEARVIAAIDRVIDALADFEQIVKQYRDIFVQVAELKKLLARSGGMGDTGTVD